MGRNGQVSLKFKADLRDPYMGNTIPIEVEIVHDDGYKYPRVFITQGEGIKVQGTLLDELVQPLNEGDG